MWDSKKFNRLANDKKKWFHLNRLQVPGLLYRSRYVCTDSDSLGSHICISKQIQTSRQQSATLIDSSNFRQFLRKALKRFHFSIPQDSQQTADPHRWHLPARSFHVPYLPESTAL